MYVFSVNPFICMKRSTILTLPSFNCSSIYCYACLLYSLLKCHITILQPHMFDVEITRHAVSLLKSRSIWKFTELTILQFQSLSQWKFYFSLYFVLFRTEFNLSFPEMWTNWGVKIPIKGQMLQFVTLHFSPAMCLLSTDQKIFGPFGILFNLSSHRPSTAGHRPRVGQGTAQNRNCPSSEDVLLSSADVKSIMATIAVSW